MNPSPLPAPPLTLDFGKYLHILRKKLLWAEKFTKKAKI
jgi:hypothetical protein